MPEPLSVADRIVLVLVDVDVGFVTTEPVLADDEVVVELEVVVVGLVEPPGDGVTIEIGGNLVGKTVKFGGNFVKNTFGHSFWSVISSRFRVGRSVGTAGLISVNAGGVRSGGFIVKMSRVLHAVVFVFHWQLVVFAHVKHVVRSEQAASDLPMCVARMRNTLRATHCRHAEFRVMLCFFFFLFFFLRFFFFLLDLVCR